MSIGYKYTNGTILKDMKDVYFGSTEISSVYQGSNLIWTKGEYTGYGYIKLQQEADITFSGSYYNVNVDGVIHTGQSTTTLTGTNFLINSLSQCKIQSSSAISGNVNLVDSLVYNIWMPTFGPSQYSNFQGMTNLQDVCFGTAILFPNMFRNCYKLYSVTVNQFDYFTYSQGGSYFENCYNLVSIDMQLSPIQLSQSASAGFNIDRAFYNCKSLMAPLSNETFFYSPDGSQIINVDTHSDDFLSSTRTAKNCFTGCTSLSDYSAIASSTYGWR
jgi:hypothetical protein